MSSFFHGIPPGGIIEPVYMSELFAKETDPRKVNMTIGAYRTEEGKPWVLPVVREAERRLAADETLNKEYLPVLGLEAYRKVATELALGEDSPAIREGRAFGVQCLSGTGSIRIGAEFLARHVNLKTAYISDPTWDSHRLVFSRSGFTSVVNYAYYDIQRNEVDIEGMLADLEKAPERSVVVLHACAHNPTGMDPSKADWIRICDLVKRRNLFTFFDTAYQGFATGSIGEDAWAIRYFVEQGLECLIAQSFAKNIGLYNERVGNLTIVVNDATTVPNISSQIALVARANWSNPPSHGARIVHMILTDSELRKQWLESIKIMSSRVREMRAALRSHLEALGTPGNWEHITKQIGLFSFTGLSPEQVKYLQEKYKIFMLKNGRVNICGLNTKNVEYVAKAFDDAVRNIK